MDHLANWFLGENAPGKISTFFCVCRSRLRGLLTAGTFAAVVCNELQTSNDDGFGLLSLHVHARYFAALDHVFPFASKARVGRHGTTSNGNLTRFLQRTKVSFCSSLHPMSPAVQLPMLTLTFPAFTEVENRKSLVEHV